MPEHYPVPTQVLVFDTADDDMAILPGSLRVETQERCGCTDSLALMYGHET